MRRFDENLLPVGSTIVKEGGLLDSIVGNQSTITGNDLQVSGSSFPISIPNIVKTLSLGQIDSSKTDTTQTGGQTRLALWAKNVGLFIVGAIILYVGIDLLVAPTVIKTSEKAVEVAEKVAQ